MMNEHRAKVDGRLFAGLPTIDEEVNRRLHQRLVEAANAAGLLDVAYRTVDTPVGTLLLAVTPRGLVRVAYASQDHNLVLEGLARDVSPRILRAPARLDRVARQLDEYFAGRRRRFDVPLDLQLSHGFRRTVLSHLPAIRYGTTASYAAVAKASGHHRAVRAVGSACASNPLPVVVPCHRVVRSDGTIGQYVGGVEVKAALLTLERQHEHGLALADQRTGRSVRPLRGGTGRERHEQGT
jgi:methylated-DNA-[protein]-cysteine S-methyltransferase